MEVNGIIENNSKKKNKNRIENDEVLKCKE